MHMLIFNIGNDLRPIALTNEANVSIYNVDYQQNRWYRITAAQNAIPWDGILCCC